MTLLLQLGTNPDMQLDALFRVTPEQLPRPVTGFTVEKVIADSHPECSFVNMFHSDIFNKNVD